MTYHHLIWRSQSCPMMSNQNLTAWLWTSNPKLFQATSGTTYCRADCGGHSVLCTCQPTFENLSLVLGVLLSKRKLQIGLALEMSHEGNGEPGNLDINRLDKGNMSPEEESSWLGHDSLFTIKDSLLHGRDVFVTFWHADKNRHRAFDYGN